jgi:hypothetical protein
MGDIGEIEEIQEVLPLEVPERDPAEPTPAPKPEEVPA